MDRPVGVAAASQGPRVVAIVQARMGSTRLSGKVLADVQGRPMIRLLLDRLKTARSLDEIVVATPDSAENDRLTTVAEEAGARVFRGSEADVLDRYYQAARWAVADVVVRVTGDCPLVDPSLVDSIVDLLVSDPRVAYTAVGSTFPDGADCEAIRIEALRSAWEEATVPSDREHVTPFIWRNSDRFVGRVVESLADMGHVRLTVDEEVDLKVVRELAKRLGADPDVGVLEFAHALLADPDLASVNGSIGRNEGLWKSLQADQREALVRYDGGGLQLNESADLWKRAEDVIPEGTQTLSKAPNQFVRGVTPIYLRCGVGAHVVDVDGNVFIDYPMALGAVLLGHAHPRVVEAVRRQMADGTIFTLMHPLEVEVAERLRAMIPSAQMIRFLKTGSEATSASIRLARAITGRLHVLYCGYHGWHDWYAVTTNRHAGIPQGMREFIHAFAYNDLDGLRQLARELDGQVAAIILEQGGRDPEGGFLHATRDLASRIGAVLIFDEIVTGFRFAPGGMQELYGVTPDLSCFGKALGNGMPIGALVGRNDFMKELEKVFVSSTFGGEAASLAAAKATLDMVRTEDVVEQIWKQGDRLRRGLARLIAAHALEIELVGHPPRSSFVFRVGGQESSSLRALFLQETVRRGILFGGPVFVTPSHSDWDIDRTLDVVDQAFGIMARAQERGAIESALDGPPPVPIFRPTAVGAS